MSLKKQLFLSNFMLIFLPLAITWMVLASLSYVIPSYQKGIFQYEAVEQWAEKKIQFETVEERYFYGNQLNILNQQTQDQLVKDLQSESFEIVVWSDDNIVFSSLNLSVVDQEKLLWSHAQRDPFILDGKSYISRSFNLPNSDIFQGTAMILKPEKEQEKFIVLFIWVLIGVYVSSFLLTNFILARLMTKQILSPLIHLKTSTQKISEGDLDHRVVEEGAEEIKELGRGLEIMRVKLKELIGKMKSYDDARKNLLSSISHDIKTPMTSIRGYVEGILDGVASDEEKRKEYLTIIQRKTHQIDHMLDELSLFSRLDSNQEKFQFEKTDLKQYLEDCTIEYKSDLDFQSIEFLYETSLEEEVYVFIDRRKIQRVMNNILENSRKFMDKDVKSIRVHLRRLREDAIIEIHDNGSGIRKENLAYIFERFYREDKARTKADGSGLGLAISKQIMEEHNGKIWVRSEVGVGTSLFLKIPLIQEKTQGGHREKNSNY
jgi:signal transduction histidine kinase